MPLAAPDPTRIPGYDLSQPTEASAVASLERVFGSERGRNVWGDACRSARLERGRVSTPESLDRAIQALADQGGAAATVARSLAIRMRTHARLSARAVTSNSGAGR